MKISLSRKTGPRGWIVAAGVAAATTVSMLPAHGATAISPYAESIHPDYSVTPIFSVDDTVPRISSPEDYRMVGIPDGLGIHEIDGGGSMLYVNHEFNSSVQSTPIVGGTAIRGAFASKFQLDEDGDPVKGDLAYTEVYDGDTFVGPIAMVGNATAAFGRFCSATLAGPEVGFDRNIFLTNEESDAPATFSPLGGSTVAIFDDEAHVLPRLGHFAKETSVVMPSDGSRTVIMSLEDGPSSPDSQLYMYVGRKKESGTVLARNGLNNGQLYTFVATTPGVTNEATLTSGTITGKWVKVPNAAALSDTQLETESDGLGAMGFVRIEDGAFAKSNRHDFYFVTTGGNAGAGNNLGRGYHPMLNQDGVLGKAKLKMLYNADEIVAGGGDAPLSPDNLDVSWDTLMIQEDGTTPSRAVMTTKGRDGSIWSFDLKRSILRTNVDVDSMERVVELNPPGRDAVAVGAGVWETSGITPTDDIFGEGSWVFDVQAHGPTTAPSAGTVEDGQLLLLRPAP